MAKTWATFTFMIIIAAAAAVYNCAPAAAQRTDPFSLDVQNIAEDQAFLSRLEEDRKALGDVPELAGELPEKVPPDHWAYKAVKYLADAGVLDGDAAKKFKGKPVSREELLAVVKKLLAGYDRLLKEGKIKAPASEDEALIDRIKKAAAPRVMAASTAERAQPPAPIITPVPREAQRAKPQSPVISAPAAERAQPQSMFFPGAAAGGKTYLPGQMIPEPRADRSPGSIPALFSAIPEKTPLPPISTIPFPAGYKQPTFNPLDLPIKPELGLPLLVPRGEQKQTRPPVNLLRGNPGVMAEPAKSEAEPEAGEKDGKESESDKKKDDVKKDDKKSAGKDKDGDKKKEVKFPKQFDKLGKTLEKEEIELTQKDAQMLQAIVDYVEKDVVKTKVDKSISDVKKIAQTNERDIEKLEEQNQRFKVTGSATVQYERTTKTYNLGDIGNSGEFVGEPSGTPWKSLSTNLYSKPRRFDDMTFRSYLTSAGDLKLSYQDFTTDKIPRNFKLRSLYAGRMSFGASPLTTLGRDMDGFYTELKLNDYSVKGAIGTHSGDGNIFINAQSLQFNLFGEARSWAYVSHISSYNKRNSKYDPDYDENDRRRWGWWSGGEGSVYMPPEKNAVTSFYMRYPLPVEGLYMTAEYAHSTYYRPGFKLGFPTSSSNYDDYDKECKDSDCGSWDEYWKDYDFGWDTVFTKWVNIPELRDQDDSFFVLFDYNKGPIQIFPMGYVRLGNRFVSKYLGLPGFSADDFGIDMLPINLQSLEILVLMGNYKKLEDNYKWDFLVVSGGETKPMFLDTSAMGSDMGTITQFNLIARLNNRPENSRLKLSYIQNKFTYYLSDDITLTGQFSSVKAALPGTCLDGNYTKITDDYGNTVNAYIGNGLADCNPDSLTKDSDDLFIKMRFGMKSQKYNLFWRTSKKSELSVDYGMDDSRLAAETSIAAITDAINSLAPQGKKYYMNFNYKYRLTDVSRIEMWYNKDFPRTDLSLANPDSVFQQRIGMNISMSY